VIFAIAAPIRLTHLGITSVPLPLKEAGEAFGATQAPAALEGRNPYALPTIMAGVTQCIMLSLSMVVIAALVGAEGLGTPVVRALGQVNIPMASKRAYRSCCWPSCSIASADDPKRRRAPECPPSSSRTRHRLRQAHARSARDDRRRKTRDEILAATGAVLGAAGINLRHRKGRDLRADGPVGLGKSTILRAVNGLNKVARGKVLGRTRQWRDRCSPAASADDCACCAPAASPWCSSNFALLPWRTVAENVGFGLGIGAGVAKAELDRIVGEKLAMVGLSKWAGKFRP